MKALIGYTGFVGSTLMKQTNFDIMYRSTNISEIQNKSFDLVVCAGAPAQKWVANKNPIADEVNINSLIANISSINTKQFILISTVDVFKNPINVFETTEVDERDLHPYGLNRRKLEKYIQSNFENHLIVRLPGLVGPGLRKNILYDFKNNNNIKKIESRSVFQFYPMVNLWPDIIKAINLKLQLVHLTAEPISVSEIANEAFGLNFQNEIEMPVSYDFKSVYGAEFAGINGYQYSKKDTVFAARSYAQC